MPHELVPHSTLARRPSSSWPYFERSSHNNAISALRRAFAFGYCDHPEQRDPAASLQSARIGKKDRPAIDPFSIQDAEILIAALHRDWGEAQGNYDEFRFFTGLRPSEQIALVVSDYDAAHRILSITKARVIGLDKDMTKTGADRRIELCPRAVAIVERQLRLRQRLMRNGLLEHEQLFVSDTGEPIRRLWYPYTRWQRTLHRLAIRYRKPYAARHTSVSWDLMIGRNVLWVARQHGHSVATMLSVYAAWVDGASDADILAIREAMNVARCGGESLRALPRPEKPRLVRPRQADRLLLPPPADRSDRPTAGQSTRRGLGSELGTGSAGTRDKPLKDKENSWRRGWAAAILAAGPSGPALRAVQSRSRRFCRTRLSHGTWARIPPRCLAQRSAVAAR